MAYLSGLDPRGVVLAHAALVLSVVVVSAHVESWCFGIEGDGFVVRRL
jgi:hypothetical protein